MNATFNVNYPAKNARTISRSSDGSSITGELVDIANVALRLRTDSGKAFWVPKSAVHSKYQKRLMRIQEFVVDAWVLEKIEQ